MFAKILKELRNQSGFTQQQLADVLNIDRSTYSYYEIGKSHPDYSTLSKLSQIFKVSTDFMIGNPEPEPESDFALNDDSFYSFSDCLNMPVNVSDLTRDEQRLILKYRLAENKEKFFEIAEEPEDINK